MSQPGSGAADAAITREQREEIVRETLADNRIESLDTSAEMVALMDSFIDGKIELDDLVQRGLALHAISP